METNDLRVTASVEVERLELQNNPGIQFPMDEGDNVAAAVRSSMADLRLTCQAWTLATRSNHVYRPPIRLVISLDFGSGGPGTVSCTFVMAAAGLAVEGTKGDGLSCGHIFREPP